MAFPNLRAFPKSAPGPYERQMGVIIANLLDVFDGRLPNAESHARVSELAAAPDRWSAGHAVFDEVRRRLLAAEGPRQWQYGFEESCCQAMYNATNPPDEFDSSSAFFVAVQAIGLARVVGVPIEAVASAVA